MLYMNSKYGMLTVSQPKIVNYLIPAVMFQDLKGTFTFKDFINIVYFLGILSYLHNYSECKWSN